MTMPARLGAVWCVAVVALLITNASASTPPRPVVRTADDAIRVAYAYWRALAPDSAPIEETKWGTGFEAILQEGVWCVSAKHTTGQPAFFGMYVGALDGGFLGAFDLGTPQNMKCGSVYGPSLQMPNQDTQQNKLGH